MLYSMQSAINSRREKGSQQTHLFNSRLFGVNNGVASRGFLKNDLQAALMGLGAKQFFLR